MPINYQPTQYVEGVATPGISAANLNRNEQGTKALSDAVDEITPLLEDGGRLSVAGLSAAFVGLPEGGTDGYVLVKDSSAPNGVAWAAAGTNPPGGGPVPYGAGIYGAGVYGG